MTISKSDNPIIINVKDFDELVQKFKAAKGTPEYAVLKTNYTGPDKGVYYVDETDELKIHEGWHPDEAGDIVRD